MSTLFFGMLVGGYVGLFLGYLIGHREALYCPCPKRRPSGGVHDHE